MNDRNKISGNDFAEACALLDLVPIIPGLPQSTFISLEKETDKVLRMSLTSHIAAQARIECDFDIPSGFSLDRRVLFAFVREGGTISLKIDGKRFILQHGRRRASLQMVPVDWHYGSLSELEGSEEIPLSEEFHDALFAGAMCTAEDSMIQHLSVVRLRLQEQLTALSCNDIVAFRAQYEEKLREKYRREDPLSIPAAFVAPFLKRSAGTLRLGSRTIGFEIPRGAVWTQIPEAAIQEFPEAALSELIDDAQQFDPILECAGQDLNVLCKAFAAYLTNIPTAEWSVTMEGSKGDGMVKMHAQTPFADFRDYLTADVKKDVRVEWNLAKALPLLEFLSAREEGENIVISVNEHMVRVAAGPFEFLLSRKVEAPESTIKKRYRGKHIAEPADLDADSDAVTDKS